MLDTTRMQKEMEGYGFPLEASTAQTLDQYATHLLDWNTRINLTAIKEPREIENKHMIDCLLLAAQPEIQGGIVDVGSGAGFPGLVIKAYKPQATAVTLMEPTGKRLRFLEEMSRTLALPVELVKERAEEAARKQWRESFDVAVARAVAGLPQLCEYCLPLVRVGGSFIAMKAESASEEVASAANALQKLGGTLREVRRYTLPDGALRALVIIEKTAATPATYPRNGGTIAKKPL